METLNLYDLSDRELLHIVDDLSRPDGWTETADIADKLGMKKSHAVGIRLSWMTSDRKDGLGFGLIERHKEHSFLWRLSREGRALKDGELSSREASALDGMDSAGLVTATQFLTRRFSRMGRSASVMMRREWQRGTVPRPPPRPRAQEDKT